MLELYKSKLLQRGITHSLLKGNALLLSKTSNNLCQRRLRSDIYKSNINTKLVLTSPLNNVTFKREFTRGLKDGIIGEKNKEMWKEYRAIDPRVIRPIDGNEFFLTTCYNHITDVLPRISAEEFKKRVEENFSRIELFNLALKKINGHYFFIHRPFKINIEEEECTEDKELDYYSENGKEYIIPWEPIKEKYIKDVNDKDVKLLYHFKIWQLKKTNQTRIKFSLSHMISDGRSVFALMDCIRRIVNGETIESNDEKLTNFGGVDRFKNLDESFFRPPNVWSEIPNFPVLPKSESGPPYQYVTSYITLDYEPVKKFISESGFSLQVMITTMTARAFRRFNNLPKETPLWNTTPCDARFSPYATEEYKKRKYYCNVGGIYVKLIGQSSLMEDFKHCKAQLKKTVKTYDDVRQLVNCGFLIDPKTFKFVPNGRFPDQQTQCVIFSSNIGSTDGIIPFITATNNPYRYVLNVYSYNTNDKLFIMLIRPLCLNKGLLNCLFEEMNKIFIPENISKY